MSRRAVTQWLSEEAVADIGADKLGEMVAGWDATDGGWEVAGPVSVQVLDARTDSAPGFEMDYPAGLPMLLRAEYEVRGSNP